MKVVRTLDDLREVTNGWHMAGDVIGVVPTMGALHIGHLSLVTAAKGGADRVIVTIFVNPTQFNNASDLETYPRTEEDDLAKLAPLGVDVVYIPGVDQMYPEGFATHVSVSGISGGLCGAKRPGHFDGVATIVTKLLLQTAADRGFFGNKDFQQLQVVKRLVRDLNIPTEIVGCPTVREDDGLALSSRNMRLSAAARRQAPQLYIAMMATAKAMREGASVEAALGAARETILAAGFTEIEYLELRSEDGLHPMQALDAPARLLAAAWLDGVRLIDNIAV